MPSPSSRSQTALTRLAHLPRLFVPATVLALTLAGLIAPVVIAVPCLLAIVAFLSWLAWLAWDTLTPGGRALRALTIGLLVGAAAARTVGAVG
ncbi:MAG: DUF6703 family protein [Nocardioidaceae bacterium]